MSQPVTERHPMAGRKKESFDRGRVEFKAPPEWIEQANEEARLGGHGNLSSFIRFVVTEYLDRKKEERATRARKASANDPSP